MNQLRISTDSSSFNHHCKGWSTLQNLFRATILFKYPSVHTCEDLEEMIEEIKALPITRTGTSRRSSFQKALEMLKREQRFFQCIERGSKADIEEMKEIILTDPFRFIRPKDSPEHLLNKHNCSGQTPLYVACKNGHLEIAKLLIDHGADFLIKSTVDRAQETSLEVAARWGYKDLSLYLFSLNWPLELIRKISRSKINKEIKSIAQEFYKVRSIVEKSFCGCTF